MSQMDRHLSRRELIRSAAFGTAALMLPAKLHACTPADPDRERLAKWVAALRTEGFGNPEAPLGRAAVRVGELAAGTPYVPYTLEEYLRNGGSPLQEPLSVSLAHFDCVTLVESCLALARLARSDETPTWRRFEQEIERMRYRGGRRAGYTSRLHYFSEWMADGEKRGLLQDLGKELGGKADNRQLRFMTEHREQYLALRNDRIVDDIEEIERRISRTLRYVVAVERIPEIAYRIETGDVLGFATRIAGLDVTHTAFANRDKRGTLRVLHAPLSGGVVEITRATLPEYVAAIRRASGILVARPV
ncbi:MAG TPA: N-acetylmuramoyl-L-alanine amidase-like domain-containing protein [Gemmatimonadales bacterium]|nr:N-acetylmuramoyl-L-alanine amidase-like domain-containing protein [Gemmatimonadales bacterium]